MNAEEKELQLNGDRLVDLSQLAVVVTCFNDGRFLKEALASVPGTDAEHPNVVIVNDGSTDPTTLRVLDELREQGVPVIDQENRGVPGARNTGLAAVDQEYVLYLDADNILRPDVVIKAMDVLQEQPEVDVVFGDKQEIGDGTALVQQDIPTLQDLLVGNRIDACAVIRRSALMDAGGHDPTMIGGYEDWDLWIRLMAKGHVFHHVPEVFFEYRVREGSLLSRADDPLHRAAIMRYLTEKHIELYRDHADHIVVELHRIQAADAELVRTAERVAAEAERSAVRAGSTATAANEELKQMSALLEHAKVESDRALEQLRKRADGREEELLATVELSQEKVEHAEELLAELGSRKDELATEAHRLVGQLDHTMNALRVQREHSEALQGLLAQFEQRIRDIEASKLWRVRKHYHRMLAILRTSSKGSKRGWKWVMRAVFLFSKAGRGILRKFLAKLFRALYLMTEVRQVRIVIGEEIGHSPIMDNDDPYHRWMAAHFARPADLREYRENVQELGHRPLISIVIPVFDPPVELLEGALRSVVDQVYPDWELCIADDNSTDPEVIACLKRWAEADDRIHVVFRKENGHISRASNSALELANGEFVGLMDHDDLLTPDALYHIVKRLNKEKELDLIYTDEDKVDLAGRHSEPYFKPEWCPDNLITRNYILHFVVVRTTLIRDVGGFREGFEGSQDHDLLLRLTERTTRIARIARVLYHWRIHSGSVAGQVEGKPYAYLAGRRAIQEALERRGEPADVSIIPDLRGYSVRFTTPLRGKVSVIIPTKDNSKVLKECLHSLFTLTEHPDFEVIVVSNSSKEPALFDLLRDHAKKYGDRFSWFEHNRPFNFSELMNVAAEHAVGQHFLYLNNDTEIISADWLVRMHEWSQRPSVGAVGIKLLFPNDTVQHAGVVIGLGAAAGHSFIGAHRESPGYFNYLRTANNFSAVTAACMMVERSKVEAVDGWEERLPIEFNDTDLCLRIRESGYHNVCLSDVEMYHHESLTRGHPHMTKASYLAHVQAVEFFRKRWKNYIDDDPCYDPNLRRDTQDWGFPS